MTYRPNRQYQHKPVKGTETITKPGQEELSAAWLVLSNGPWVASSIGSTALAVTILVIDRTGEDHFLHGPAIFFLLLAMLICLWTIYSIITTWRVSRHFQYKVFPSIAFIYLIILLLILFGGIIWMLVLAILD